MKLLITDKINEAAIQNVSADRLQIVIYLSAGVFAGVLVFIKFAVNYAVKF